MPAQAAAFRCRNPLPVAPHLRRNPWQLSLPREHPEAHAILYDLHCWMTDPDLPFIVTDILLDEAEAIDWEGQA